MEKFIRKLLNLDFDNLSYLQRLKFSKEYLRLCERKIPEHTTYPTPKLHLIINEFDDNHFLGSSNDQILSNNTLFISNNRKNIVESTIGIGHETCHGGYQKAISYNTSAKNTTNTLALEPDHFRIVYDFYERYFLADKLRKGLSYDELVRKSEIDNHLKHIEHYLKGFYYLHPMEQEANNFGIQMVEDIIEYTKTIDLTPAEQQRLDEIILGLQEEKESQQETREEFEEYKNNILPRTCIQNFATYTFKTLEQSENLEKLFENLQEEDFVCQSRSSSWKPILIMRLLELNYDDKLAHKLLNALLRNKNSGRMLNAFIYNFVWTTDIQLAPDEEKQFRKIMEECQVYSLDYETFLQEKERHRAFINDYTKKTPEFNGSGESTNLTYHTFKFD